MTHQASRIPWNLLASPLEWTAVGDEGPDLRAQLGPGSTAGSDLNDFVDAFLEALSSDATSRHSPECEKDILSGEDDIILDNDVVRRISPALRRIAPSLLSDCFGDWYRGCRTGIPPEQKTASAFQRPQLFNRCGAVLPVRGSDFYNLEIFKILLLRGEMDAVLRVCGLPEPWTKLRWRQSECMCSLQRCPNGDCNCRSCLGDGGRRHYRDTKIYQHMLLHCTASGFLSEAPRHYHRQFFGITRGQFNQAPRTDGAAPGSLPIEDLLVRNGPVGHVPTARDVHSVQLALRRWGLPTELALLVMDLADYFPQRRLEVPDDPLHPDNRRELEGYLDWCWDVLMRCLAAKRACGNPLSENRAVGDGVVDLLNVREQAYYVDGKVRFRAQ